MTDLDEVIRRSIKGPDESYLAVVNDLHALTTSITQSIRKHAGLNNCDFVVHTEDETIARTIFALALDLTDYGESFVTVSHVLVPAKGYPIQCGDYLDREGTFHLVATASNAQELQDVFANVISDPNGAFLQAIAFGMRKAKEAEARATEQPTDV